jgi:hypothetical protein
MTAGATGVMTAAGRSSGRRPRPPGRAGAVAVGMTAAAVAAEAVAGEAAHRQAAVVGAEWNRLKKERALDELGGPFVSWLAPRRPYRLRFPTPSPNKKCTA